MSGVVVATALVMSCDDSPLPTDIGEMPFRIADAAHAGHNLDFFFLPPLVPDPSGHLAFDVGGFDPGQPAEVQVCALVNGACDPSPEGFGITYTMQSGPGSEVVRVSESDEHYSVNWHTDQFVLDTGVTYRIGVSVAGTELGYADVDLVASGSGLKNVDTDQYIALKDGRTLPIKFRIEHGAVHVVDASGGTVTAAESAVTMEIPAGALGEAKGITVIPVSGHTDPPLVAGTAYEFGPDGLTFNEPVMLTIAYDASLLNGMDTTSLRIHKLVGDTWEVVPDGTVDLEAGTATAWITGFSRYAIVERELDPVPPEYRVFFMSWRDGNENIYGLGPDSVARALTTDPAADRHPAISPDGNWIAFNSNRDGEGEIYVMDVAGTSVQQLTFNDHFDHHPDWSPDGTKIVYASAPNGNWDVWVMNADGSGQTPLTVDPADDYAPDWSPNGDRIAFNSDRDGDHEIFIMDATNGAIISKFTNNDYDDKRPDWSPDGRYLAWASPAYGHWDIYSSHVLSLRPYRLTHAAGADDFPQWSPNGEHILFRSFRDGNVEIYVMNADGSGQTNLTNDPAQDDRPAWGVRPTGPVIIDVMEAIQVSDVLGISPPVIIQISETIAVSDAVQVLPPVVIDIYETIDVADGVLVNPPVLVDVLEAIQVSDQVSVSMQ
jgi:Tol biopolymer transport system component